jgi:integrase
LQLRVKDLDFDHGTIIVREGKGSKDRALMLGELKQTSPKFHRILGMTSTFVGLIVP